ncbi:hypothetical protein ACE193_15360 [Bernardetia sp. OM2101]|uniref:hypothetical protein n=1 Tax=Bernardetia sp. OM2101 TaxID=3344876 RepID=UPI0035D05648
MYDPTCDYCGGCEYDCYYGNPKQPHCKTTSKTKTMSTETKIKELLTPLLKELTELHQPDGVQEEMDFETSIDVCIDSRANNGFYFVFRSNYDYPNHLLCDKTVKGLKNQIIAINLTKDVENIKSDKYLNPPPT